MINILSEELNWFWDLIDKSEQDKKKLASALMKLDQVSLQLFMDAFEEASLELRDPPYIDHLRADISGDSLDDITHWVVSQGKEYYTRVLEHPKLMPTYIALHNPQNLWGIADNVYEEKFGDLEDDDF